MRVVSTEEKKAAFLSVTQNMRGADGRWAERTKSGLKDAELADALRYEIGIAGGSCGPDAISIHYQGAGLKIWASWEGLTCNEMSPIFEGRSTITMAREVYGIANPDNDQLSLF